LTDTPQTPAGFVPVFPGWNVWSVWQKNDLDFEASMFGVGHDQRLKIWVENEVQDNAPGAAVSDPLSPNPTKFRGDMVQIIPDAAGLEAVARKEDVPGPTALVVDGDATLRFVRFYNRGPLTVMPWPHDGNYLLDSAYLPSVTNPVTAAPAPASTAATATEVAKAAASIGSGAVVALGLGLGIVWVLALAGRK
jgi:hypothetical protein